MTQIFEWTVGEARVRLEWPDGIKLPDVDIHLFPEDESEALRAIRAFECAPPDDIGNSHRKEQEEGRPDFELTVFSPRQIDSGKRRHPWQERFAELHEPVQEG